MDSSPTNLHRGSLLVPGLLLILLILTSTNFAVFLKQQCHWAQKIPLVSKMITCPTPSEAQVTIDVTEEKDCFEVNVEAFRVYESFDALGDVAPDRTARGNRTVTIKRSVPQAEPAVHRIVITRNGAVSPLALALQPNRTVESRCATRTVRVYSTRPE